MTIATERRARRPITSVDVSAWRELYEGGMGTIEIGERFDRAHSSVYLALARAGVRMRPAGRKARTHWERGFCGECGHDRPLNPRTGWCSSCTRELA
jgi:hypothetical protein